MPNQYDNQSVTSDFISIFQAFTQKLAKDVHVAEMVRLVSVANGQWTCIVVANNAKLQARALSNLNLQSSDAGKLAVVLFLDHDYRTNYSNYISNNITTENNSDDLHNVSYGVIIGLLN